MNYLNISQRLRKKFLSWYLKLRGEWNRSAQGFSTNGPVESSHLRGVDLREEMWRTTRVSDGDKNHDTSGKDIT